MATHVSQMLVDADGQPYANYIAHITDEDKVTAAIIYDDADELVLKSVVGKVNLGSSGYLDVYLVAGNYFLYVKSPQGVIAYSRVLQVTEAGYGMTDNSGNAGSSPTPPYVPPPSAPPVLTEDAVESLLTGLDAAPNLTNPGFLVRNGVNWYNATDDQVQSWLNVEGATGVATFEYAFNWGDATPWELMVLPADKTVYQVQVTVKTAFDDPAARISIGDIDDLNRLLDQEETNVSEVGTYEVTPGRSYVADTPIQLSIQPAGSTQGQGILVITFQR